MIPGVVEQLLQVNPRLAKALGLAGLSRRDMAAYVLLLTRGPMTAAQLAREMNTPLSKAYQALSRLIDSGLAIRQGGRPSTYAARPPREAWLKLKTRLLEEISYVEEKLIPALEAIAGNAATYNVYVLGQGSLEEAARRIVLEGSGPLRVAVAFKDMVTPALLEALRETMHRRRMRILVAEEAGREWTENFESAAEIRYMEAMFGGGFIGDEVLLIIRGGGGLAGLWSSHEYFVSIATIYFDHLWETARPG